MEVPQQPTAIRWLGWILATAGGLAVALAAVQALVYESNLEIALSGLFKVYPAAYYLYHTLLFGLTGMVIGPIIGLGQWLVLRRQLPGAAIWILVTALGLSCGNAFGNLAFSYMTRDCGPSFPPTYCADILWILQVYCIEGAIFGMLLGLTQWIVLRRQVRYAGWWIPTNTAAWAVGSALVWRFEWALSSTFWPYVYGNWPPPGRFAFIYLPNVLVSGVSLLSVLPLAIIVGTITGVVLRRLSMLPYRGKSQ